MKNKFKPTNRKFLFLNTLDWYIAREYLIILILCLIAFNGLILVLELFSYLGNFLTAPNTSLSVAVNYFINKQVVHIGLIVPVSLFLSCVYFIGKMESSNEIKVIRSAGISLFRFTLPIYIIAMLITAITVFLNLNVIPQCKFEAMMRTNVIYYGNFIKESFAKSIFYKTQDEKTWNIESFVNFNELCGVYLKKTYDKENYELVLRAPKVTYSDKEGWKFFNATVSRYGYQGTKLTCNFDTSYKKVIRQIPSSPVISNYKLIDRNSPIYKDFGNLPETPYDIINTVKQPPHIPASYIVQRLKMLKGKKSIYRNILKTELYSRVVFPFLSMLLLGIIITIIGKNNNGRTAFNQCKAVILITIYMFTAKSFLVFGYSGAIPPFIAVILPAFIMVPYFYYLNIKN